MDTISVPLSKDQLLRGIQIVPEPAPAGLNEVDIRTKMFANQDPDAPVIKRNDKGQPLNEDGTINEEQDLQEQKEMVAFLDNIRLMEAKKYQAKQKKPRKKYPTNYTPPNKRKRKKKSKY